MEYAALIVLAALIIGTLYEAGIPARVKTRTTAAVCQILHTGGGCATSGNTPRPGATPSGAPTPGTTIQLKRKVIKNTAQADNALAASVEHDLGLTRTGQFALAWIKADGAHIAYHQSDQDQVGFGSWDNKTRTINLNVPSDPTSTTAADLAQGVVDGEVHGREYPSYAPDRTSFIKSSIESDALGYGQEIQENEELRSKLGPDKVVSRIPAQIQADFDNAITKAEAQAKKNGRTLSPDEKNMAGSAGVEDDLQKRGDLRNRYGDRWDDANCGPLHVLCWF